MTGKNLGSTVGNQLRNSSVGRPWAKVCPGICVCREPRLVSSRALSGRSDDLPAGMLGEFSACAL